MRLWSLHPVHLDRQGLTACWREGLLAQAVLAGNTRGYTSHPQLERFRACGEPLEAVGNYLWHVADQAAERGYRFDGSKILRRDPEVVIHVTTGQLDLEWQHLLDKLRVRSPEHYASQATITRTTHPMMREVSGPVESWERHVGPESVPPGVGRLSEPGCVACPQNPVLNGRLGSGRSQARDLDRFLREAPIRGATRVRWSEWGGRVPVRRIRFWMAAWGVGAAQPGFWTGFCGRPPSAGATRVRWSE